MAQGIEVLYRHVDTSKYLQPVGNLIKNGWNWVSNAEITVIEFDDETDTYTLEVEVPADPYPSVEELPTLTVPMVWGPQSQRLYFDCSQDTDPIPRLANCVFKESTNKIVTFTVAAALRVGY
jgi:hypothetical protein